MKDVVLWEGNNNHQLETGFFKHLFGAERDSKL